MISLFGKGFAKNAFNSEKVKFNIKSDVFTKNFSYSRYLLFLKKSCRSFGILHLHGVQWQIFQRAINISFCNLVSGMNYSDTYFTLIYNPKTTLTDLVARKLLWSAFKLKFTPFLISKSFISHTSLKFYKRLGKS